MALKKVELLVAIRKGVHETPLYELKSLLRVLIFDLRKVMSFERIRTINHTLKLAHNLDEEKQVLMFIEILYKTSNDALTLGSHITLDESMISSGHRKSEGETIIPKPRPVGVEVKNLCDSRTMINLVSEKAETKELKKKLRRTSSFWNLQ